MSSRPRWLPPALLLPVFMSLAPSGAATADCIDYRAPYLRRLGTVPASFGVMNPVVSSNRLVVPTHAGFSVYGLADPAHPALLGSIALPNMGSVAVTGDLVVVGRGADGITVVTIATPGSPVILGTVDTPGSASRVVASGSYAYVADGDAGLAIVSLADPAHPDIVGQLPAPGGAGRDVRDVAVKGPFAFLACGDAGLLSVDVSTPATPVVRDSLPEAPGVESVAIQGNQAAVTRGAAGLSMVNIENPRILQMEGSAATGGDTRHAAISGTHALLFDYWTLSLIEPGPGVLYSLDVSDPANPRIAGKLAAFGNGEGIALAGGYGYVADSEGSLAVIDARNLESPPVIGSVESTGHAVGLGAAGFGGPLSFVAGVPVSSCGTVFPFFQVVDVTDPAAPAIIGYTEFDDTIGFDGAPAMAVSGHLVLIAVNGMLKLVSVAQPTLPQVIGTVDLPRPGNGLAVKDSCAFVACWGAGLVVVDFSNPAAPAIVANFDTGDDTRDVTVEGSVAYVGAGTAGLDILEVSNPRSPSRIARLDTPGNAGGIALAGRFAYVADDEAGLTIVDRSTPPAPVIVGTVDTPDYATRVAVDRDIAYVADGYGGLEVIDVRDPAAPVVLGDVPTFPVTHVTVTGGAVHLVAGMDGYQIRATQCVLATGIAPAAPAAGAGLAIRPNPASTGVRFLLAPDASGDVRVSIYDISGRLVRDLDSPRATAGRMEYAWDGCDDRGRHVASGVYLVRAAWPGHASTGRVTILR